jgi:hypothetical protein
MPYKTGIDEGTIKLIYFDTKTDRVNIHLFMPVSILREGSIFMAVDSSVYEVRYYDDVNKVAFAVRKKDAIQNSKE